MDGTAGNAIEADAWEERDWENLLDDIADGSVIPIIGSELLRTEVDGKPVSLYRVIAERLAQRLRLQAKPLDARRTINDVVCEYLQADRTRNMPDRVYARICEVFQDLAPVPPETLKQLAAITDIRLFVTTTADSLMERALNEARFGGISGTSSVAFNPREPEDLSRSYEELDPPVVYHLFGRLSKLPDQFVASDEDLLEFFFKLQNDVDQLPNLFDALGENHLLFLGGAFSDWLARLFLRAAKRQRLSEQRIYDLLAGDGMANDPNLVLFLRTFASKTRMKLSDPVEFVAELSRRWQTRHPERKAGSASVYVAPPQKMPHEAIFISYAHEDIEQVRALKGALDAAGLNVWFDKDQLMAGDDWEDQIERNLRNSSLFLPIISHHTQTWLHDAYFRAEWNYADAIARRSDASSTFIVPVSIDEIPAETAAVPKTFRRKEFAYAPNGIPSAAFIDRLRELVQSSNRVRRPQKTAPTF